MATRTPRKITASTRQAAKAPVRKAPARPGAAKALQTQPQPVARPAPAPKPAKPAKAEKAAKPADKVKKPKLVRDSFTIPKTEYESIAALKTRAAKLGHSPKKSELLRAGIKLLASLGDQALLASLAAVPSIKTGRPAA